MTASRFTPALLFAALLLSAIPSQAQEPQARLAAPIVNTSRATLAGSQPPRARLARDLGAVDSSTPLQSITMHFSRSAQQQADLDALIAAQQDPSSPQYHQWLTPADFGVRFGLADADIAKTQTWLQSQGFTVLSVSPSRNSITFSGTASTVASAFGAPLHRYSLNGENHIAPSADLTLPAALAGIVSDVRNLSDFRPRPHVRYGNGALYKPNFTSSQTGNHFLTPGDIAVIYDIKAAYNAGYNGSGVTIAVMGQSAIVNTDITKFQTAIGQTAKAPTSILVPNTGSSAVFSGDESESDLDLEYATGMAPGATIDFIYVGSNATSSVFDSLTWAIQNRIAPILNISYGECEPALGQANFTSMNALLQQAAAQGQTVVSASGDDGSTDCYGASNDVATEEALAVDFPSSSQFVTSVGGTEFTAAAVASGNNQFFSASSGSDVVVSALSYIPETAWNDDSASFPTAPLSAGGGGASIFSPAPTWQTGVPGIPSGSTMRLVPDISLDASPNNASYAYCTSDTSGWASGQQGSCTSGLRDSSSQDLTAAGGTSFAAPIFSGMVAILSQAKGYTYQGLVNPTLYTLASNPTTYASAFHDIVGSGNYCNIGASFCSPAGAASFNTSIGYDEATGLGSIDLNNLLAAWPKNTATNTAKAFTLGSAALSLTESSSTAAASGTSAITITPVNGYTGTIAWTVTSSYTVPGGCYSIANSTVSGTSPVTATLTVSVGNTTCPSGTTAFVRNGSQNAASHIPAHRGGRSPAIPALATLGIVSLLLLGRRSRCLPTLLAIFVLSSVGLGLSGCGGATTPTTCTGTACSGGGGTTPTTASYTITVIGADTATSAITANTTLAFNLTVQ
jgi:subtilase family serine protease